MAQVATQLNHQYDVQTILEGGTDWTKVQEVMLETPIDYNPGQKIDIEGVGYYIHGVMRVRGRITPIMFVVIERCPERANISELTIRHIFGMTPAESRVAIMLSERRTNREISVDLAVSAHTARRHTEKVLSKLGIHRRTEVRNALESKVHVPNRT
jgi:DNA-binding CsgD family transcriptional regulator